MKKKLFVSISIILIFLLLYLVNSTINNPNIGNFTSVIKDLIPNNVKSFLLKTIFIHKNQEILKSKIKEREEKLLAQEKLIESFSDLPNIIGFIPFSRQEAININFNKENFVLKKFKSTYLLTSKITGSIGNSYIDIFDGKLFLATANGILSFVDINKFNEDNFQSKVLKTNIKSLIKYEDFYKNSPFGIKDLSIIDNNFYLSYTNELTKNCYNTSILKGKINYTEIVFEKFFVPEDCVSKVNSYGSFNAHSSGGKIIEFDEHNILLSTGEFLFRDHAQNEKNVFGKILIINKSTKDYKIVSMGHRNIQGLYYDKKNDELFSTEHGPQGGDEININNNILDKINNYGWPISSYGEHYNFKERDDNHELYIKAPLHNSHSKYGFIEPLKYFTPSIAISEIIKIDNKFSVNKNKQFLVGAMGRVYAKSKSKINGNMSIHYLSFSKNNKLIDHKVIKLDERVRDIIYSKDHNKIFLFLETSASIAIIEKL